MKNRAPARTRNAAATREAILKSARAAFARSGYDGVGVRDIAAGAGVTAMLINRYFGSKEGLFAEVVTDAMTSPVILSRDNLASGNLAKRMAKGLAAVSTPGQTPLDGFQIMIRSAASDRAAEISRDRIETGHQKTLADALEGPHAAERAALALALVAGVQSMRQTIGLKALAQAHPEVLEDLLERMLEPLVGSGS